MLCLSRELGFACRSVLRFLDRSVAGTMGCFFACFRVRDDRSLRSRPHLASNSSRSGAVVSQNRLSSLFLDQEKGESSPRDTESPSYGTPQIDKELKKEAKFLKACGTLVETPVELRKASSKHHDTNSDPSKFNSWLPNTSITKLQQENQSEQPPTPVKLFEEWGEGPEHTPISYESNLQSSGRISMSSTEGSGIGANSSVKIHSNRAENSATQTSPLNSNVQCRGKSVRFECDFDTASSKGSSSGCRSVKIAETPGKQSISKFSAYPTPLTLSDEMQTPGTVYPASQGTYPNGKFRIRSEYVYSVPNPEWNVLKEEDSNSHGFLGEPSESLKQFGNASSGEGQNEISSGKEFESSMSSWLKPVTSGDRPIIRGVATQDDNNLKLGDVSGRNRYFGRTPGDRPIIGGVATHWNEDDPTRVSPKWWDGNGIPNSTNKYKEDQKVSWHATPFEERLEKALSEESFISQRKHIEGMPIVFDEHEESDTALSQLQSSSQPKSVVSF